jgi:hypothetical protein
VIWKSRVWQAEKAPATGALCCAPKHNGLIRRNPVFLVATTHASAILLLCSIALLLFSPAAYSTHTCADSFISVEADEPVNYRDICGSAEDALTFFSRLDLEPLHPLVVEVVSSLPDTVSRTAIGCYLEESQRVLVLTFAAVQKRKDWFGVPVDRSMYRSLVTHEVAHAVADCNFAIPDPTIQAHEYVAYIAMFAMMNPNLRDEVMARNPGVSFDSEREMNTIIYMFDPMRFGVAAYRHYLEKGNGDAFLLRVLSGDALTNRGLELPSLRFPCPFHVPCDRSVTCSAC